MREFSNERIRFVDFEESVSQNKGQHGNLSVMKESSDIQSEYYEVNIKAFLVIHRQSPD